MDRESPPWAQDLLATLTTPLLSRDIVAQTMGCSKKTVDRRIRLRELKSVKIGNRVLVPRTELVAFLVARSA